MDNILFILTDQFKSDCLGFHGNKIVKTPNLDKLAEKSVDFVNSHTVTPLCTPARGSLMTGLYPHQSGIIDNCDVGGSRQEYLPESAYTWLDAMIDKGYKTGYIGKWHLGCEWYNEDKNIYFNTIKQEGKANIHKSRIPLAPATERGEIITEQKPRFINDNSSDRVPFYKKLNSIEDRIEYKVKEEAISFLDSNKDEPWCLTVSFSAPHFPNSSPEPYYSMYNPDDIVLPENHNDRFLNKPWFQTRHWWPSVNTDNFSEDEWKKTVCAYYSCITMVDNLIGEVLEKAKNCSGGRKTKVIFTADHGEMMSAHSRFDKNAYFYEEVMKTPLLICDDISGKQNHIKTSDFCSSLDIAETFFDLADKKCKNGRSLIPYLTGEQEEKENVVYSNYYKYNGHSFEIRCIKTEKYKYSFIPQDIDELYDLQNDPYELNNLNDTVEYQQIKKNLKDKLLEHMNKTDDYLLDCLDNLPQAGCLDAPEYPEINRKQL